MGKCSNDIRLDLIDQISKEAISTKAFSIVEGERSALQINDRKQANVVADVINKNYKENIISPSYSDPNNFYVIEPSDDIINRYLSSYNDKNEDESSYLQTDSDSFEQFKDKLKRRNC